MLYAIDTSSLILLQKLKWLSLCQLIDNQFILPPSVISELKQRKGKNKSILDLLTSGIMSEYQAQRALKIEEISSTDSDVIALASEHNATVVSEDTLLRQKATKLGVSAISISALIMLFYQHSLFSKEECLTRLKTLHDEQFLSKSEYRQLLQRIIP